VRSYLVPSNNCIDINTTSGWQYLALDKLHNSVVLTFWIFNAMHMILAHSWPGWLTSELIWHLYVMSLCLCINNSFSHSEVIIYVLIKGVWIAVSFRSDDASALLKSCTRRCNLCPSRWINHMVTSSDLMDQELLCQSDLTVADYPVIWSGSCWFLSEILPFMQ